MPMPRKPANRRMTVGDVAEKFAASAKTYLKTSGGLDNAERLRDKAARSNYYYVIWRWLEAKGYLTLDMERVIYLSKTPHGRPPVPREFSVLSGTNPKEEFGEKLAELPPPVTEEPAKPMTPTMKLSVPLEGKPKIEIPARDTALIAELDAVELKPKKETPMPPAEPPAPPAGLPSLDEIKAKLAKIKAGAPAPIPASPVTSFPDAVSTLFPGAAVKTPTVRTPPPPAPKDPLVVLRESILAERYGIAI